MIEELGVGATLEVVSLSKALYLLLSTGSTQEDLAQNECKIVDRDSKSQNKQTKQDINFSLQVVKFHHKYTFFI